MSCPECLQGAIHEGQPRGEVTKIHGLDTYVSEPADGRVIKGIMVIIPDALGWVFVNNRLLADHYADKGDFRVYLPDFMAGWSAPVWMLKSVKTGETGSLFAKILNIPFMLYWIVWLTVNRIGASYSKIKTFLNNLRHHEGADLPIGAAGFCWGGKHVVLLAADPTRVNGKLLIDAGFTGHPSLLKVPNDIEKMKIPVSFAIGEKDSHLPLPVAEKIKDIVESKPAEQKGEVVLYPNCSHGFCVRADIRFEEVAKQATAAEDQCIRWFNNHFEFGGN